MRLILKSKFVSLILQYQRNTSSNHSSTLVMRTPTYLIFNLQTLIMFVLKNLSVKTIEMLLLFLSMMSSCCLTTSKLLRVLPTLCWIVSTSIWWILLQKVLTLLDFLFGNTKVVQTIRVMVRVSMETQNNMRNNIPEETLKNSIINKETVTGLTTATPQQNE